MPPVMMPSYHLYDEKELLTLLMKGDQQAFTEIYNRYWKKLYALAYHRLNSKQSAEDIVQEVLTSLWQRKEEINIRSLNNYLAAATKYCILSHLSGKAKKEIPADYIPAEAEAVNDYTTDLHFLEQMIQTEINKLPNKCRLVFQYSRQMEMSNKEIAEELNISQKTVEKHITKALRELRLQVKEFLTFFF